MSASQGFEGVRKAWARYVLMIAALLLLVVAVVVGSWPEVIDAVVERILLREFEPSPWPMAPAPAAVAGCYELSFGGWVPKDDLGPDASFVEAPLKVELTIEPDKRLEGWFVMRPAAGEVASIHRWTSWYITPDRTVKLVWSTGFSGLTAELGPHGRDLQGRAKTFWDFPRNAQMASLRARRISCGEAGQK